jgi:hypothetical protein
MVATVPQMTPNRVIWQISATVRRSDSGSVRVDHNWGRGLG